MNIPQTYTTFDGFRRIASGTLQANALAVYRTLSESASASVLVFSDATGASIDVNTSGSERQVAARYADTAATPAPAASLATASDGSEKLLAEPARGRGRPKLGVVAREVTLLPRQWEWLASQPGGTSVALRKLVDEARRANLGKDLLREAQTRAYHFMSALAGDLPGFEEASRALFANDRAALETLIAGWPSDVRAHVLWLAYESAGGPQV
jgi:hypothetical protein